MLEPIGDKLIVRPRRGDPMQTGAGVIVPDTARRTPLTGTVEAVGGRVTVHCRPGDEVIFMRGEGSALKLDLLDDAGLIVLRSQHILGTLERIEG
jgi:co-chaperonin GroES (HSP10)